MATKDNVNFDEDEDLFGFADPAGTVSTEEDDIDIAEFLSTIDDDDVSSIVELAGTTPMTTGSAPEAPVATAAAGVPTQTVVVAGGPIWRQPGMLTAMAIGGLLLISNLAGTWATWSRNRTVVEEIEGVRLDLRDTVANAKRDIAAETSRLQNITQPRGGSQLGTVSFLTVEEHLNQEDFATARRLLYSKLAILDRLPVAERDEVESRALFLLAESDMREAAVLAREVGS